MESVSEYTVSISEKKRDKIKTERQNAKKTKGEKRTSVENLTEFYDIACEFALCTFTLLH